MPSIVNTQPYRNINCQDLTNQSQSAHWLVGCLALMSPQQVHRQAGELTWSPARFNPVC